MPHSNVSKNEQESFKQLSKLISNFKPNDIEIVIKQEQDKQLIENKANFFRNEIHAVIIHDGLSSLFVTINLADLHSSIVIIYAEKEVNINTLILENFSTATERAKLSYLDPTVVAKYFNIIIEKIIEYILGYRKSEGGVLGEIKNYYAIIEYQDQGIPHCHILIWLQGASNLIKL
ncbi:14902_t:CDS:2 [Cetraspora pellucida]|uniref:14902_t:CDS:1 n=1 Tax=Cetraspora pellucida TaxID=1433469 RepID=A0A9N9EHJ7_9GLOM|nr:14902_t:CDS:2 [Cetraspora pellucida]